MPAWAWEAAGELYREMERIDGEAMAAGQAEQDPAADEYEWRSHVGAVIARHARKCAACGGRGKRWLPFVGHGSCDVCRGSGVR
jgi:hypothetical protein